MSWLVAIAHNRAHRFFRSRRAKVIALEEARQELKRRHERKATEDPDPDGLEELVATLPDEYRWALTWKYLEGVSYHEIGERLSLSFHQVDYLLRRAKTALRRATQDASRQKGGW